MLNIYMNSNNIENQMSVMTVTLKRDLRCMMYIDIDETFTVYVMKLQNLIITMSIINAVKMMKSEL